MKKIVIIGGGITGLSTAWKLAENGREVIIVESSNSVGGLAKSVKVDNYYLDIVVLLLVNTNYIFFR